MLKKSLITEFKKRASKLIPKPILMRNCIDELGDSFPISDINFDRSPTEVWSECIDKSILIRNGNGQVLLIDLIEIFYEKTKDVFYSELLQELKFGFDKKAELVNNALESNNLILVLGQDFNKYVGGKTFLSLVNEKVKRVLLENEISFDSNYEDVFFYLAQNLFSIKTFGGQKKYQLSFLTKIGDEILTNSIISNHDTISKLNKLKIKSIINFNYENTLSKFFPEDYEIIMGPSDDKGNDGYDSIFKEMKEPEFKKKIILNVFGGLFEDKNSRHLVATENQLVDYIQEIFKNENRLSDYRKIFINNQTCYLFLGFDFNTWYVKIFFKLLFDLNKENNNIGIHNGLKEIKSINKEFYENDFNMIYIDSDKQEDFLDKIISKYQSI